MSVAQFIGGAVFVIVFLCIVIGWIIIFFQWILCRKKNECDKEKCVFRLYCINDSVCRKEVQRLRKMMLENKKNES